MRLLASAIAQQRKENSRNTSRQLFSWMNISPNSMPTFNNSTEIRLICLCRSSKATAIAFGIHTGSKRSALFPSFASGVPCLTVARAHFALAESLAKIYEKHITYDVEHLCIAQTLLPHLWRAGVLGGRSFDVLMARFPAKVLERHLDDAARLYPYSKTLTEFRAPRWFVEAEEEALHSARRIISPHPQITNLFGNALRLPWAKPIDKAPIDKVEADQHDPPRDLIVFLGPTLARKGAYAVREAVKRMGFSLVVLGPDLEQPGFWNGLPIIRTNLQNFSWNRVHAVLQPALIEYWPRQLLRAQAARSRLGVSPNCGIAEDPDAGVHHVPFGDVDALVSVTETLLTNRGTPLCAA